MLRVKSTLLKFILIDIIVIGVIMIFAPRHQQVHQHDVRKHSLTSSSKTPACELYPDSLLEKLVVNVRHKPTEDEAIKIAGPYIKDGCYDPPDCIANQNLAVIVPYKNREQHLITLMHHLHPILQRQQLRYCIFVTEQYDDGAFNKARIMNAGVLELLKSGPYKFDCLIFHDVDMLVEDDRNLHRCLRFPHHLSAAIDKFNYTTSYGTDFGGVGAISTKHYFQINGHSNRFYGWGGEDTDIETRLNLNDMNPIPASDLVGRYKMIPHEHPWSFNPRTGTGSHLTLNKQMTQHDSSKSTDESGVSTIKYSVKHVLSHSLYTKFNIDVRTFIIKNAKSSFDDFNKSIKVENPFFTNKRNYESTTDGKGKILGFGLEDEVTAHNHNCSFQNFPGKIIYHKPENDSDIYEIVYEDLNEAKNICINMLKNCSAVMVKSPGNFVLRPSPFMHEKILRFRQGPIFKSSRIVSTVYEGESIYMKICENDARFLQFWQNPVNIEDREHNMRSASHRSEFDLQIFQADAFQLYYSYTIYSAHEAITRQYEILAVDSAIFVMSSRILVFNSTNNATLENYLGNYKTLDEVAQNEGVLQIVTPPIPATLYPGCYICENSIIDGNDVAHLKWRWWFQVVGATKESEKIIMDNYLPNAKVENSRAAEELLKRHRGSSKLPYNGDAVVWSIIFMKLGNIFA